MTVFPVVYICCRRGTREPCGTPLVRAGTPEEHSHPGHEAVAFLPLAVFSEQLRGAEARMRELAERMTRVEEKKQC